MPRAVRYRILRKIAHGGMAEIFLALQVGAEGFQKPVVLKRILPAFAADPHFVRMLVDEAHIVSTLNHSHLVQILDLGKSSNQFFLVLEFVDGWSLEQVRRRAQKARLKFPLPLALYIVSSLCRALSYVHLRARDGKPLGIVHRDISPQNVLLGREGEVKLADFGIAKASGRREKSATGIIKGKFAYMSPEQSIGTALDGRSDLFSVGTLLYILTTGKKPFDAPTDLEVLMQVRRARFEKPSAFQKEFNLEVERFIGRALRADRGRRWQSAEQMADRLDAILVKLGQPTGPAALKRWLETLSARDGIKPPGDLPELATEISVGTIELETGDLELHDTGSGEFAVSSGPRGTRTREAAASASLLSEAAPSTLVITSPSTAGASLSGSSYVSVSMAAVEEVMPAPMVSVAAPSAVEPSPITALGPTTIPSAAWPQTDVTSRRPSLFVLGHPAASDDDDERADEDDESARGEPTEMNAADSEAAADDKPPAKAAVAAAPVAAPLQEVAKSVVVAAPVAAEVGKAAAGAVEGKPVVEIQTAASAPEVAAASKPVAGAAVVVVNAPVADGKPVIVVGGKPIVEKRTPLGVIERPPRPRDAETLASLTPPWEPIAARVARGAAGPQDPTAKYPIVFPPIRRRVPTGAPKPLSDAAVTVPDRAAADKPRAAGATTDPLAPTVPLTPMTRRSLGVAVPHPHATAVPAPPVTVIPAPPVTPAPPPAGVTDDQEDREEEGSEESESLSSEVASRPRRRWRRRLLVAVTSVGILAGGGYFSRSYWWSPYVAPHVEPTLPPWVVARMRRPIEGWLRSLPARLHLGTKQQVDQGR